MDERILSILKAVAQGPLSQDNQGYEGYYCVHCLERWTDGEDEDDHGYIMHKHECPVIQAREIMHENGLYWRE